MFDLSKLFCFDAARPSSGRTTPNRVGIRGRRYRAEVTVRRLPDPVTGMVVDLGVLERTMAEARDALDHRFLDEINDLGPATMENLSRRIWDYLSPVISNLFKVSVYRDSGCEAYSYWGKEVAA